MSEKSMVMIETYDDVVFEVPFEWFEKHYLTEEWWSDVEAFESSYTWDDGEWILRHAKEDGVAREK